LRRIISIMAAKLVMRLAKLMGHKGTNLGGEVALRIYPRILDYFGSQVREKILFVTGTNGKTSTNNMIYSIIRESGKSCVSNRLGANLDAGLISAFIDNSDILGRIDADYACLEVDESTLPKVMRQLKPDAILFTNIFQERRDKLSNIDTILNNIKISLDNFHNICIILNADDPSLVHLGERVSHPKIYYGIDTPVISGEIAGDEVLCWRCTQPLTYNHNFYASLGHYSCQNCGFQRPDPDYEVTGAEDRRRLRVTGKDGFNVEVEGNFVDTYSIYNTIAAVTYGAMLGLDTGVIQRGISKYKPQLGRMELFDVGKPIILNLAKNPVGFDESMKVVVQDPRPKTVVLGINDLPQDGTDVSWLWDTNFEMLKEASVKEYAVFGRCSGDMARRLEDAGIDPSGITTLDSAEAAVEFVAKNRAPVTYMLVNYSLLFETQGLLKRRAEP
jgi:UDP-N-acetylmuramyl tripeptide synthase